MVRISRRHVVQGAAAVITLGAPSVRARNHRQTLRFVAQADLKVLDPVWTTAYITRNHSYLVYDTLFGTDENLQIKPQMVERVTMSPDGMKYTFTLREGLRWHDGKQVQSEDCVESLKRWGRTNRFGQLLMAHTGKIAPIDKRTFSLELADDFGPVLDALGHYTCPLHDAGADRVHLCGGADHGDCRLWTIQVREGRVATGRAGRVRAQPRLHPARRSAERINRRQEGVP
jgi:ABC-type transport system substrate-binding protein